MLDLDGFSKNRGIPSEPGLPEGVAENDIRRSTELCLFIGAEKSPQNRLDPQHFEVIPGHLRGVNPLRRVTRGQGGPLVMVGKHPAERAVGAAQIAIIRIRERRRRRDVPASPHDAHQAAGIAGARHGPQHGAFDPPQRGAGGAYTQRQHQDRACREVRAPAQLPQGITDVVEQSSHEGRPMGGYLRHSQNPGVCQ